MKYEGGRMKEDSEIPALVWRDFILHPSAFILMREAPRPRNFI